MKERTNIYFKKEQGMFNNCRAYMPSQKKSLRLPSAEAVIETDGAVGIRDAVSAG